MRLPNSSSCRELERSVGTLFAGAASMPTDKFRVWAASTPTIAVLFEPLARH